MSSPSTPIEITPITHQPNPPEDLHLSLPLPPNPPPQPLPSSFRRRIPPPCWSHYEIIALIDSYCEKWYSLRRGSLKGNHWQDVADAVGRLCPNESPPKTAVQCRHKMEKLRKRYRNELQRAQSMPHTRFTSSWVHFKRMHSMEKGPSTNNDDSNSPCDNHEEKDHELYGEIKNAGASSVSRVRKLYENGLAPESGSGGGGLFRRKTPSAVSIPQRGLKNIAKNDEKPRPSSKPNREMKAMLNFGTSDTKESTRVGKKEERDPMAEMVYAIKLMGDGFVRMEETKMEMVRQMEITRMKMERKRTEMMIEMQQRIVETFAKAMSEK